MGTILSIVILAVVALWAALALAYIIISRRKGKCVGCGGDCSSCRKKNK